MMGKMGLVFSVCDILKEAGEWEWGWEGDREMVVFWSVRTI